MNAHSRNIVSMQASGKFRRRHRMWRLLAATPISARRTLRGLRCMRALVSRLAMSCDRALRERGEERDWWPAPIGSL